MEEGVGSNDPEDYVCHDYTDEEIKNDREAVDWESAQEEVELIEEQRK
jgi:hypothetical protein